MKKKRTTGIFLTALFILAGLMPCLAQAANQVQAKILANKGKVLVANGQNEKKVYDQADQDLLITPDTTLTSMEGTCVVKINDLQFILDAGDSLRLDSSEQLQFTCLNGIIEAISGEKNIRLTQGEMLALAKDGTISRSRSVRSGGGDTEADPSVSLRKTITSPETSKQHVGPFGPYGPQASPHQ